jgi:hypothetical protein
VVVIAAIRANGAWSLRQGPSIGQRYGDEPIAHIGALAPPIDRNLNGGKGTNDTAKNTRGELCLGLGEARWTIVANVSTIGRQALVPSQAAADATAVAGIHYTASAIDARGRTQAAEPAIGTHTGCDAWCGAALSGAKGPWTAKNAGGCTAGGVRARHAWDASGSPSITVIGHYKGACRACGALALILQIAQAHSDIPVQQAPRRWCGEGRGVGARWTPQARAAVLGGREKASSARDATACKRRVKAAGAEDATVSIGVWTRTGRTRQNQIATLIAGKEGGALHRIHSWRRAPTSGRSNRTSIICIESAWGTTNTAIAQITSRIIILSTILFVKVVVETAAHTAFAIDHHTTTGCDALDARCGSTHATFDWCVEEGRTNAAPRLPRQRLVSTHWTCGA